MCSQNKCNKDTTQERKKKKKRYMGNTTYFAWVAFDLEIYTSEKANSGETNEKKRWSGVSTLYARLSFCNFEVAFTTQHNKGGCTSTTRSASTRNRSSHHSMGAKIKIKRRPFSTNSPQHRHLCTGETKKTRHCIRRELADGEGGKMKTRTRLYKEMIREKKI